MRPRDTVLILVLSVGLTASLGADPIASDPNDLARYTKHLDQDEKSLGKMQAGRGKDQAHMDQAQKNLSEGTAKLSEDHDQQRQKAEQLKALDDQVTSGDAQEKLDQKSYNAAVTKYGPNDPASTAAKETLKTSHQAMKPLRENRQALQDDIQSSHLQIHNDKTIMGMQQRVVDSDSRYLSQDDSDIKAKEKTIENDNHNIAQNQPPAAALPVQPPTSPLAAPN